MAALDVRQDDLASDGVERLHTLRAPDRQRARRRATPGGSCPEKEREAQGRARVQQAQTNAAAAGRGAIPCPAVFFAVSGAEAHCPEPG